MQKIPEPLEMPSYLETLHGYVLHTCGRSTRVINILAQGNWPCPQCNGLGRDWDPDDPPCIIEGNKMRNRITCPHCKGTCVTSRSEWQRMRDAAVARYNADARERRAQRAVMRQALDKLTPEEAAALGWEKPEPTLIEVVDELRAATAAAGDDGWGNEDDPVAALLRYRHGADNE